jgi:hypothetical protein
MSQRPTKESTTSLVGHPPIQAQPQPRPYGVRTNAVDEINDTA